MWTWHLEYHYGWDLFFFGLLFFNATFIVIGAVGEEKKNGS